MKHFWRQMIAGVLALVLCLQLLPGPALAYMADRAGNLILTGKDGSTVAVDESWEETFPYGTFAFQNSELKIQEGGETGVLQVYRLGGTVGRAIAYIQYQPAYAQISEDAYTYANAAGYGDVRIEVEDPLPIAQYQPIGKEPGPFAPDVPVGITVETPEVSEKPEENAETTENPENPASTDDPKAPNGEALAEDDYILTVNTQADAYQWYAVGDGLTKEITGAADPTLIVGAAYYANYDFFCVYTVDDVRYGSASAKGVPFVEEEEEKLEKAPDGLPLNPAPMYSPLEMDPDDPYQTYIFEMTFADGEWVKEIRITAPQDELSEPDKFGAFTIIDCKGASLYNAANTLALHVVDDEAPEASQLGFTVTEAEFDKSAGTAELTVRRTGGKQNVVSVEYATEDGTAVSGEDYSPVSGTLLFYADVDEQTIRIPLIDDGVESQERVTFQVVLSNVKGGGEEELCTLTEGMDIAQVSLYNSNTAREENLATLLRDGGAVDLSSQVSEESGSVVPLKTDAVTGEQTAETPEELEAVIGYGPDDIVPYTFTYSTPIRFSRSSIKDYNSNYWDDRMNTTYNKLYNNCNQVGLGSWGSGADVVDGGRRVTSKDTKSASLYIPNLAHYFCEFDGIYKFKADGSCHWFQPNIVVPYSELKIGGSRQGYTESEISDVSITGFKYTPSGSITTSWGMGSRRDGELILGLENDGSYDAEDDAYCHMERGNLKRRTFGRNSLSLRIYTANDADTAPSGAAQLTSASGVYNSMRPRVTLVPGESGVTSNGQLYVGSKLKIELANTASYFPAQQNNAVASYDYTVYLTNSSGGVVQRAVKSGGAYYLTMDWDSLRDGDLGYTYTLNIVMTRKQNVTIDLTPSVDRMTDAEGNPLLSIDTSKIPAARDRFNASGSGGAPVTVGRSASSASAPHYEKNIREELLVPSAGGASYKLNALESVLKPKYCVQRAKMVR